MTTTTPKASEIQRDWHIVDAEGMVLGRLATEVANVLRGKHKPTYTPNLDTGDHVVIVNADKIVLTSGKADRKMVYSHSGFPGGLKESTYADEMAKDAAATVSKSIKGMLPKTRLGRQQITKLKVYAGPEHPHVAQNPQPLTFDHAKHRA